MKDISLKSPRPYPRGLTWDGNDNHIGRQNIHFQHHRERFLFKQPNLFWKDSITLNNRSAHLERAGFKAFHKIKSQPSLAGIFSIPPIHCKSIYNNIPVVNHWYKNGVIIITVKCNHFTVKKDGFKPVDAIKSGTSIATELLNQQNVSDKSE